MNAGLDQDAWGDLKQEERSSRQLLSGGEARLLQQATNIQEAHNDNMNTPAFADGYWVMFDEIDAAAPPVLRVVVEELVIINWPCASFFLLSETHR